MYAYSNDYYLTSDLLLESVTFGLLSLDPERGLSEALFVFCPWLNICDSILFRLK